MVFLLNQLILGPLGEELGWRGYALPRLLRRFTPFIASLVLGVIWGLWHFPSFFMSGVPQSSLSISLFLPGAVCLSVLVTWLFIHTNGSVLITVMFHFMVDVSLEAFGTPFPPFVLAVTILAVLVVALDNSLGWFHRGETTIAISEVRAEGIRRLEGMQGAK